MGRSYSYDVFLHIKRSDQDLGIDPSSIETSICFVIGLNLRFKQQFFAGFREEIKDVQDLKFLRHP